MKQHNVPLFAVFSVLWASTYSLADDGDTLTGRWRGDITEKERPVPVELKLLQKNQIIEGSFRVLTRTGQDVDKGMVFPVVQADMTTNALKIIVALVDGKVDDDALVFDLMHVGEELMNCEKEVTRYLLHLQGMLIQPL